MRINQCDEWQNLCGLACGPEPNYLVYEDFSFRCPLVYPSSYLLAHCAHHTYLLSTHMAFTFAIQDRRPDDRPAF